MRLDDERDVDDEERETYWYAPPPSEERRETAREVGVAACKTILDKLGPAPLVAGSGARIASTSRTRPTGPVTPRVHALRAADSRS